MALRYVQAELEMKDYDALKRAARTEKVPIKEFVREAILARVRERHWKDDPFWSIIGIAEGGDRDAAEKHDEIYDEV
jgi:hypothetical protein